MRKLHFSLSGKDTPTQSQMKEWHPYHRQYMHAMQHAGGVSKDYYDHY